MLWIMQEGEDMLLIDSDVFIIDSRYRKDAKYRTNKNFLDFVHEEEKYTTIFNLLEITGILKILLCLSQLLQNKHNLSGY